jgi:DNA gyrase subunit B
MKIFSRRKVNVTGDDAREGLTAIISVKVPDPKFLLKQRKIGFSEVKPAVRNNEQSSLLIYLKIHKLQNQLQVRLLMRHVHVMQHVKRENDAVRVH